MLWLRQLTLAMLLATCAAGTEVTYLGGITNGSGSVWVTGAEGGVGFHAKGMRYEGHYWLSDAGVQLIRLGLRALEARRAADGPELPMAYRIGRGDLQVEFPVADRAQVAQLFIVLDRADQWITAVGPSIHRSAARTRPAAKVEGPVWGSGSFFQ